MQAIHYFFLLLLFWFLLIFFFFCNKKVFMKLPKKWNVQSVMEPLPIFLINFFPLIHDSLHFEQSFKVSGIAGCLFYCHVLQSKLQEHMRQTISWSCDSVLAIACGISSFHKLFGCCQGCHHRDYQTCDVCGTML